MDALRFFASARRRLAFSAILRAAYLPFRCISSVVIATCGFFTPGLRWEPSFLANSRRPAAVRPPCQCSVRALRWTSVMLPSFGQLFEARECAGLLCGAIRGVFFASARAGVPARREISSLRNSAASCSTWADNFPGCVELCPGPVRIRASNDFSVSFLPSTELTLRLETEWPEPPYSECSTGRKVGCS